MFFNLYIVTFGVVELMTSLSLRSLWMGCYSRDIISEQAHAYNPVLCCSHDDICSSCYYKQLIKPIRCSVIWHEMSICLAKALTLAVVCGNRKTCGLVSCCMQVLVLWWLWGKNKLKWDCMCSRCCILYGIICFHIFPSIHFNAEVKASVISDVLIYFSGFEIDR